ncbi:MAG: saccharopine dehydrogenase NADP-binding domain-containing protein [Planctomycetota bacterium]|nr:saccharopine dehydrogenase NADP-binding domain-containing protein [Planctomycetota bacterium]MDA1213777.1 saccharopine dehydrogenase NADP-binding domain-containing protein [Planctomycetota bacterium]
MSNVPFHGKLLVLGCGSVARCTLPLILRHVEMPANRITILEMEDLRHSIPSVISTGVRYIRQRITPENYTDILKAQVGPGDMIVDLTWNLETVDLLDWCHRHDVRYLNTSVEQWDPYADVDTLPLTDRTLYYRQMEIRQLIDSWGATSKSPTAVLDHGANPGLVSHFTKTALLDIAQRWCEEPDCQHSLGETASLREIEEAASVRDFPRLAMLLGVRIIHISEWDTQYSERRKKVNEFVNTWSIEGLYEEGIAPAEMGWGTHERYYPRGTERHRLGPRNQICLQSMGINTWVRSWVPSGEIAGMVIRHGEAFSISDRLTVWNDDGKALYRPTVHYAYHPCKDALKSLEELRQRNYQRQSADRIMGDEIASGRDELGCLLMGHPFKSWWIGSLLDIHEARRHVPGQNATTLQVAASVLGAMYWMIRNPHKGVMLPDDLPHEEILDVAKPYLGPIVSQPVDWPNWVNDDSFDDDTHWQFKKFLLESPKHIIATQRRRLETSSR